MPELVDRLRTLLVWVLEEVEVAVLTHDFARPVAEWVALQDMMAGLIAREDR